MKPPLNLETLYGDRFRITMSEDHEVGHARDPWNFEIIGRFGKVYPFGAEELCAFTDGRYTRAKLLALGIPHQVGTDEVVIRFKPESFEAVASLLRLYRKPTFTPEQHAANVERLRGMGKGREAA